MSLGRRHVLGLGALGAGAVALDACGAGLPWAKTAGPAPGEVDRVLLQLDAVLARLGALEPDVTRFGLKPEHAEARGTEAVKHLLASVCCLGSYRDVPASTWEEPRVEERLAKTLPFIHRTLEKARAYIDGMSAEQIARVERKLQHDPDFPMRVMEQVDVYAKEVHAPLEQRTYLRATTAQLAGRFRYEGVKEVTSKLTNKYARTLASRKSELGMAPDDAMGGGDDAQKTDPTPVRAHFRTRATASDVHAVACTLEPSVTGTDGTAHPILLDWEEFRCPTSQVRATSTDALHGAVHLETTTDGDNIVSLVVYPLSQSTLPLEDVVLKLGNDMKRRLEERLRSMAGTACNTSADCHGLRCVSERCVDPNAPKSTGRVAVPDSHLGTRGDSCRTDADCADPNTCVHGACDPNERTSSKLMKTTGKAAKWGAILLIPPICAIGILILVTCLFMVIVAGFEYAGGD